MTNSEMLNLLDAYYMMGRLKFQECLCINGVTSDRCESKADVIFSAQQLAWLDWSEKKSDVNIAKVIAMLSLSSLEDVTPYIIWGGNSEKQKTIRELFCEFCEAKTVEARFAQHCKVFQDSLHHTEEELERLEKVHPQVKNMVCVYHTLGTLKPKIRQGIINWNITGIRRESVSEHVYSVQQLAWLMWLATDEEIDIFRVISMLSIHETEESIIGDITPFCGITPEEKLRMGHEAVEKLLGGLKQFDKMYSLIKEFDAEETPDAFFAHLCDKLDCDLAVKYYSDGGYCSIANATQKMKDNPRIQKFIADGGKTVADMFIMADEHMYTGTIFEKVIDFVKYYDVTQL